jgi:hypothetical protein
VKKQKPIPPGKNVPGCSEPTVYELARLTLALEQQSTLEKIVYALAQGPGTYQWEQASPEASTKEALKMWLTAREVLEKWRANPASALVEPAPQSPPEPEPKKYPVKMDEFVRLVLPKLTGRTAEQGDVFRRYLKHRLRKPSPPWIVWDREHTPKNPTPFDCCDPQVIIAGCDDLTGLPILAPPIEPTKDAVDQYFARWNNKGIPNRDSFLYHKRWFCDWYDRTHPAESSAGKRENALKGHAKRKLRRYLWELSCKENPKEQVPLKQFPEVTDEQMARLLELNKARSLKDYKNWSYNIDGLS